MEPTRRGATDRAIDAYQDEAEAWKRAHVEAGTCLDLDEVVALGNSAFEAVARWDAIWHQKVNGGAIAHDVGEEQRIDALYRHWLAASGVLLDAIGRFEGGGYEVAGSDRFRRNCEDVRGLLTPDHEFFGEELLPHQEAARAAHHRGETEAFEEMGD